ncbi:MAG: prepilin-type N-terminal cleavage/methylation domain-containing protein [Candidatus Omnitrophica bacterium]|nr:prepilin-type N-terminal cleavage/methylation domain-containing protein [Candidatus Omnitrophota bacterium]
MRKGFTMIEVVIVIVVLAVLAAVAIPRYIDLQNQANESAEAGVAGGVRAGIATYYIEQCAGGSCVWPTTLDSVAVSTTCDATNPCFGSVLEQSGIADGSWAKDAFGDYNGPDGGSYTYDNTDGSFE